jgi:hypothetical protein
MESDSIDISALSKGAVLAALYNASKPQGLGRFHFDPSPMSLVEAEALLAEGTHFDYVKGRVLKVNLSGGVLRTTLFDRDNGPGAAARAVAPLFDSTGPGVTP